MATNNAVNSPVLNSNGQLLIGSAAAANGVAATLTAGVGISIINGAGAITINGSGSSGWVDETTDAVTMIANTGYTSDDSGSVILFTLPSTSAIGDFVEIIGRSQFLYNIIQTSGQQIHFGTLVTTLGATGQLQSTQQYDCIRLRCITVNTTWVVVSAVGNFIVI